MSKVKLELRRMTILAKAELANRIVAAMTGNPNFVTPNPSLAATTAAKTAMLTAYNTALTLRQQAQAATDLQADMEKGFERTLTSLSLYVESAADGNDAKIQSAGMSVKDLAVPVGQLYPPLALSCMAGNKDGEIDLNWEPVRGANSYLIQMTTDPNVPDSWADKAHATESFAAILGLTSGNKYWFRVAGIGAAGQGAFSGAESKYAP